MEMWIFLGCLLGFGLLEWLLHRRRERQLKELTMYLLRLQDHLELPAFASFREGQLGILQSEIYKASALLGEQSRRAKRESTYLADMMSDISHQIKTPLAAITLMTDLLKEPGLPEEKRLEFAEKIDSQAGKINWLIRNLLTLARMEADMLELKKERVRARELLERACAPLLILAEMRGVTLKLEAGEEIWLVCDAAWTAEALGNIVKNCIEHTGIGIEKDRPEGKAGGVQEAPDGKAEGAEEKLDGNAEDVRNPDGKTEGVEEKLDGNAEDMRNPDGKAGGAEEGWVRIAVMQNNFATSFVISDNGCGIAKEDLPHIFERFYKGRHASKNSVGIGLAMAQKIIMRQNGTIQVQSEEGRGSSFRVKLFH